MGEATTRRRAPSPSNTRKFVEADARSTDLLPKSSTSHARRPSTNFLQVREEPEFILHDLAGPYPVQNSPSKPQNADFGPLFACRENFVPLPPPTTRAGRTLSRMRCHFRYKTLPARPARRPTRYKTLPASGLGRPTRYKTLPASPKTPISAHFSHAGRTLYRFRHQHDKQGEKSHAPTPHRTHQRAPPQISHAIRLNELSTKPRNVAIPTT